VKIFTTERLLIRELDAEADADFINRLLNSEKFIKYIGDRKVRSSEDAHDFIRDRYRKSYEDHGYGLYCVELIDGGTPVGMCGFVRRDTLPAPDIGFAFLPEFEGKGYGFESAEAMMSYGREQLGFSEVLAITTLDNDASGRLLEKTGFKFDKTIETPEGETLRLFRAVM
jgi:RimJ/RimL family protein N-acetyltransferase